MGNYNFSVSRILLATRLVENMTIGSVSCSRNLAIGQDQERLDSDHLPSDPVEISSASSRMKTARPQVYKKFAASDVLPPMNLPLQPIKASSSRGHPPSCVSGGRPSRSLQTLTRSTTSQLVITLISRNLIKPKMMFGDCAAPWCSMYPTSLIRQLTRYRSLFESSRRRPCRATNHHIEPLI